MSASDIASSGFIKRGVPIIPSVYVPPYSGTSTRKALLTLRSNPNPDIINITINIKAIDFSPNDRDDQTPPLFSSSGRTERRLSKISFKNEYFTIEIMSIFVIEERLCYYLIKV